MVGVFGRLTKGSSSLKIALDEMHDVLARWLEVQLEDDRLLLPLVVLYHIYLWM